MYLPASRQRSGAIAPSQSPRLPQHVGMQGRGAHAVRQVQHFFGFNPMMIGKMTPETLRQLKMLAEDSKQQAQWGQQAQQLMSQIIENVTKLEQMRAEVTKEGMSASTTVIQTISQLEKSIEGDLQKIKLIQQQTSNSIAQAEAKGGADIQHENNLHAQKMQMIFHLHNQRTAEAGANHQQQLHASTQPRVDLEQKKRMADYVNAKDYDPVASSRRKFGGLNFFS